MVKKDLKQFIYLAFLIIVGFALLGTGLSILYNSNGDLISLVGGFVLIGIAIAIAYRIIENE